MFGNTTILQTTATQRKTQATWTRLASQRNLTWMSQYFGGKKIVNNKRKINDAKSN
jgi:hypothetical protein